jgi:hypothetical protein
MSAPSSPVAEVWPVWTDFVDNWRAIDAHWFRDRVVNVFDNVAARTASGINASAIQGSLTFLQDVNSLEFYKGANVWESVRYPNLAVSSDATTVTLRQTSAGSGIILQSDGTAAIEKLNAGLGTMLVGVAGLTLKVGANKAVVLTTDATSLAINSPVKVTGDISASTATIAGAASIGGTLTVPNIGMSGTLTGGVLNGSSGTIGGVAMSGNRVTPSDGMLANGGRFRGDGASAIMQANGGGPYLQVTTGGGAYAGGGQFDFYNNVRFLNNTYPVYYYAGNGGAVNIAPSFYSGGDPGAGNFPDGTIWIT